MLHPPILVWQVAALAKSTKCKTLGVILPEGCGEDAAQSLAQVGVNQNIFLIIFYCAVFAGR